MLAAVAATRGAVHSAGCCFASTPSGALGVGRRKAEGGRDNGLEELEIRVRVAHGRGLVARRVVGW